MTQLRYLAAVLAASALTAIGFVAWYCDDGPRWACAAEDEVVVIDDTCRHVDEL